MKTLYTCFFALLLTVHSIGQVKIAQSESAPDNSSILELESDSRGFLPPRLSTEQRDAIVLPAKGLIIFNTDINCLQYNKGTDTVPNWICTDGTNASNPPCGEYVVTDLDDNTYQTVPIGDQCWLQSNLKTSKYRNGNSIPQQTVQSTWITLTTDAWAYYDNDPVNNGTHGKLYNWYAVNHVSGLCPLGWHVPSQSDWTELSNYLGGDAVAGGMMKTTSGWNPPNTGASNLSNFSATPSGVRYSNTGSFNDIGNYGLLWSSSEVDSNIAHARYLWKDSSQFFPYTIHKRSGYSVRCLKD